MAKIGLGSAILNAKCPRCRKGNIFPTSLYSFRKLTDVHQRCPECNAVLTPEPDFFYGAMYISYAFSVALVIGVMVLLYNFFKDPPMWIYILTVFAFNILFMPLMLRYSKVLYLYGLGRLEYNPNQAD